MADVRQPMTHVLPETKSLENICIDLAKRMNLSGFGDNGFGAGIPLAFLEEEKEGLAAALEMEN